MSISSSLRSESVSHPILVSQYKNRVATGKEGIDLNHDDVIQDEEVVQNPENLSSLMDFILNKVNYYGDFREVARIVEEEFSSQSSSTEIGILKEKYLFLVREKFLNFQKIDEKKKTDVLQRYKLLVVDPNASLDAIGVVGGELSILGIHPGAQANPKYYFLPSGQKVTNPSKVQPHFLYGYLYSIESDTPFFCRLADGRVNQALRAAYWQNGAVKEITCGPGIEFNLPDGTQAYLEKVGYSISGKIIYAFPWQSFSVTIGSNNILVRLAKYYPDGGTREYSFDSFYQVALPNNPDFKVSTIEYYQDGSVASFIPLELYVFSDASKQIFNLGRKIYFFQNGNVDSATLINPVEILLPGDKVKTRICGTVCFHPNKIIRFAYLSSPEKYIINGVVNPVTAIYFEYSSEGKKTCIGIKGPVHVTINGRKLNAQYRIYVDANGTPIGVE